MPSKMLRDKTLGRTRVRLVRRDDGTLQGGYWRPDRNMIKLTANLGETEEELWKRLLAASLGTDRSFADFDGTKAKRGDQRPTGDTPTLPSGVTYFDDDDAYFAWLADNPDGYVVNVRRTLTRGYVQLHRATCRSISVRREPGAYTERDYRKLCARTRRDISRAPTVCGRPEGSFTAECSLCQP